MKFFLYSILLSLVFTSVAISQQTQQTESQKLNQQIITLYNQRKFDEAISLAEKLIQMEKKRDNNSQDYIIYLKNLAALRKGRIASLQEKTKDINNYKSEERLNFSKLIVEDIDKSINLLREALSVNSKLSREDNLMSASLKIELAWALSNSRILPVEIEIQTLYNKVLSLYTQALATQEKLSGNDSDETLKTVLILGGFFKEQADFESALPYYERYVNAIEKKYGTRNSYLVFALSNLGEILANTDREAEADEIAKRISKITNKTESPFSLYPDITKRAKDNINFNSSKKNPGKNFGGRTTLARAEQSADIKNNLKFKRYETTKVNITIDEKGEVIEANSLNDSVNKKEIEQDVLKWKFRPFIYKGVARKMRGSITYIYPV